MAKRPGTSSKKTPRKAASARRASAPPTKTRTATREVSRRRTAAHAPAAASHAAQVQAYFAKLRPEMQQRLQQMRALILAVAPNATEWFSYGIPGFRLDGRPFVWYAAFSEHVSLYPMTAPIRTTFAAELERLGLETSKGTIRFPLDRPLPASLVKRLVKAKMGKL